MEVSDGTLPTKEIPTSSDALEGDPISEGAKVDDYASEISSVLNAQEEIGKPRLETLIAGL